MGTTVALSCRLIRRIAHGERQEKISSAGDFIVHCRGLLPVQPAALEGMA
jgi:hypothetical protein